MQAGGGYKMLALLLRQKKALLNEAVLMECFKVSVTKFEGDIEDNEDFLFTDWDAMKFLLLNHQVWDVKNPKTLLSQLAVMNSLVSTSCRNCSFNARGLYHVQIVDWAMHLMVEAISMYNSSNNKWHITPPSIALAAIGADSQDDFLLSCKTLLKRILSNYLDKKKDLQHVAETLVYTLTVHKKNDGNKNENFTGDTLTPAGLVRVYLLRLLLELVLEGVQHLENTAVLAAPAAETGSKLGDLFRNKRRATTTAQQPGAEARQFLDAFASTLTPTWFACMLEGCDDDASASLTFRLLILILQSCPAFAAKFSISGGFRTLILSVPKFSTSPCIILPMLAALLNISISKLPYLPSLDPDQLIVLFDSVAEGPPDATQIKLQTTGLCALISECVGRNIQLSSSSSDEGDSSEAAAAKSNNSAILRLLSDVHASAHPAHQHFRELARADEFLEPLVQSLFVCSDVVEKDMMPPGRRMYSESAGGRIDLTSKIEEDYVPSTVNRKASFERRVSASKTLIAHRKGSTITQRNISSDVGLRFAGPGGKDILQLILLITESSFERDDKAETLQTLITAFPAHATEDQVFSYYDVILHSLNETLAKVSTSFESPRIVANLINVGSCLLTNILNGLFAHDAVYDALVFCIEALKVCQSTRANRILGAEKQNSAVTAAVRIAQNTAIAVLRRCDQRWGPAMGPDVDQVTSLVVQNLQLLLMRLNSSGSSKVQTDINSFVHSVLNLDSATADRIFTVCLLSVQLPLLQDSSSVRENACSIISSLLTVRKATCLEMFNLGASLNGDDGNVLGIRENEVSNGFSLLLQVQSGRRGSNVGSVLGKSAAFFEWLSDNTGNVEATFDLIREAAEKLYPDRPMNPSNFVLQLQKEKVSSMGGKRVHSEIMFKGIERSERVAMAEQKTIAGHEVWKKRGFDDLTSGAMGWKKFLRQIKGELGIWERNLEEDKVRWKLDLSEGPERIRRKMLRNWEFYEVYNVEEEGDKDEVQAGEIKRTTSGNELRLIPPSGSIDLDARGGGVEVTAEMIKMMSLKAGASKKRLDGLEDEDDDGDEKDEGDGPDTQTTGDDTSVASSDLDVRPSPTLTSSTNASPVPGPMQARVRLDSEMSDLDDGDDDGDDNRDGGKGAENVTGGGGEGDTEAEAGTEPDAEDNKASTFELLRGLVQPSDMPDSRTTTSKICYNVSRCTGLEVKKALLLFCKRSIYFVDGFELIEGDGLEGTIERVAEEEVRSGRSAASCSTMTRSARLQTSQTPSSQTSQTSD